MKKVSLFALVLCAAVAAGCISLSFGETKTTPTMAQELKELKDSMTAGQLTPQEYDVAKNALLSRPTGAGGAAPSNVNWASHSTQQQ